MALVRTLALLVLLSGCSIDDIDYAGKGCSAEAPCPDGLVCNAGTCSSQQACSPKFTVSNFRQLWATPGGVRWAWQPEGTAFDFVQYKLVLGENEAELEAARDLALAGQNDASGGAVWTRDENPELGRYEFERSGNVDPVEATTTDGLESAREYRARVLAYDNTGCVFESDVAFALTRPASSLSFTLFDDAPHPNGAARPPQASIQTGASQAHEGDAYVFWNGFADGTVVDAQYENIGVQDFATVPAEHYPLLDFSSAYLEVALAIEGEPIAAWGEVRLIFGPSPGVCEGIEPSTILPYAFRPGGGYRVMQFPLAHFEQSSVPIDEAYFESRALCEVSMGRLFVAGETVRVDSIRLRW